MLYIVKHEGYRLFFVFDTEPNFWMRWCDKYNIFSIKKQASRNVSEDGNEKRSDEEMEEAVSKYM